MTLDVSDVEKIAHLARLGIDADGELYLLTKGDGWVRKLIADKN